MPVGVASYEPDPGRLAWRQQDKKLKRQGLAKGQRPPEPPRNRAYPIQPELGLRLLEQFRQWQPTVTVQCVLADALYGMAAFMDPAGAVFDGVQVISQLRGNQKVCFRNRRLSLAEYFDRYSGVVQRYRRRGGQPITVWVSSARLFVEANGKKRLVIALKYEGESEYRYLVASDLTWRTEDIVQAFTLRWLVEVFIQDWKG
jgi:hypothetical protein